MSSSCKSLPKIDHEGPAYGQRINSSRHHALLTDCSVATEQGVACDSDKIVHDLNDSIGDERLRDGDRFRYSDMGALIVHETSP